jgi:Mn2+/Fe2+ NRAMP family transporter
MGAALQLIVPGPQWLYVAAFAILIVLLEVFMRYASYVSVLRWLTLSLFAYVATVFVVGVPWGTVAFHLVVPHVEWTAAYFTIVVAIFGTTISPYLFFWQSSEEAEDERVDPAAHSLIEHPEEARSQIRRIEIDTYVGMGLSNLVAFFIIVTTAATLHAHGVTDVQTSEQAAEALRPIAGNFAFIIFALGILGTGLLAVPVLAGSSAYALAEAMQWEAGLSRSPNEARQFYATIVGGTVIGVGINFINIDPIKALFWSAVINGVAAVPLMVVMMIMTMQSKVMGRFTLPRWLWAIGWVSTAAMAFAVVTMLATWGD